MKCSTPWTTESVRALAFTLRSCPGGATSSAAQYIARWTGRIVAAALNLWRATPIGLGFARSGGVPFVLIHLVLDQPFRVNLARVCSVRVCLTPVLVAALSLLLGFTAPVAPASSGDGGNPAALRALARDAGAGDLDLAKLDVPGPDVSTVVLGRKLFFSPDLSLGKDVSCATCAWGG